MSVHVVATAGHVDHGKSSLVQALTGTDPDRFAEEKRRGLTIDLGFAWSTLPSGREVGFVDVPGHERFIRNMLAGVGPVRRVLFIVAADEGWQPQSEEHLAILDVLGVDGAVVALTKSDLVDDDALAAARVGVAERLRDSALADAPILPVSARTGYGVDALIAAIDAMLAAGSRTGTGADRARQFLDRAFSIKGAGTVVTGTLTGGSLSVGDDVEILPGGLRGRIRGLQTHKRAVQRADPVSRTAVNLSGIDRAGIGRGDVLVTPGAWLTTTVFEARVRPIRGRDDEPWSRGSYRIFLGTAEREARIRRYPGSGLARIRLDAPAVVDVFDRFVIRDTGRNQTVAGGMVLDPSPPVRAGADAVARLESREAAGRLGLPSVLVAERGAVRAAELLPLTGCRPDAIPGAAAAGSWWIALDLVEDIRGALAHHLASFHADNPARAGADLGQVRTIVADRLRHARRSTDLDLIDALLELLVGGGSIVREQADVRLADHVIASDDAGLDRLLAAVAGMSPPDIGELVAAGHERELIASAVTAGTLVRVSPDLVFTSEAVAEAEEVLRAMAVDDVAITVSAFRERAGTSRKYAVPLLEYFDRRGVTRREGDRRVVRSP